MVTYEAFNAFCTFGLLIVAVIALIYKKTAQATKLSGFLKLLILEQPSPVALLLYLLYDLFLIISTAKSEIH